MQTKIVERYFFFGLFFLTFIATFLIFQPFWIVLILAISFAVILHPLYEWLHRQKLPDWLSALLTLIFFLIVVCGPLLGIGALVFHQSQDVYNSIVNAKTATPFFEAVNHSVNKILPAGITFDINAKATEFISFILNNLAGIFSTTLSALFSFFIMLLALFNFLKDGAKWRKKLIVLSPLTEKNDEKILGRLSMAINGVIKGYLLIAFIQGTFMTIGLTLFGVPHAALWGVLTFFTSFIPVIGPSLVSVPSIIFLFLTGQHGHALGLLIWVIITVPTIDNYLNPLLISRRIDMPPLIILFSVLGGISLLGPVGILMGPLSISLLYALGSIYRNEYKENVS